MVANLSLNQFAPNTPVDGMYVYMANEGQLHNVIVGADVTLKAGDFVKLDSTSTNTNAPVVVDAVTADAGAGANLPPFGVVTYTPIKSSFAEGERVGLARDNDVVWKTASAAISAGTPVIYDANQKVKGVTSSDRYIVGVALTPASAAGDLIQVLIKVTYGPASL